jgi:hypothetical protein
MIRGVAIVTLLLTTSCSGTKHAAVEDLSGGRDLSHFGLTAVRGTRDGDRLNAQAVFGDGSSPLTLDLHFAIGSPTTLESGRWRWADASGLVTARSVTFLGGQSGVPSIGGRFDLLSLEGVARFRVTIPVTELRERLE